MVRDPGNRWRALCRTIYDLAKGWKAQGHRLRFFLLNDVKHMVRGDDRATHQALIETIVRRSPSIWLLVHNGTAQQAQDWANVCLALALADVAMHSST